MNRIDMASVWVCASSMVIGVFITGNEYSGFVWIGFVALIVMNLTFLTFLIYKILIEFLEKGYTMAILYLGHFCPKLL
jgi:hypothetical protein